MSRIAPAAVLTAVLLLAPIAARAQAADPAVCREAAARALPTLDLADRALRRGDALNAGSLYDTALQSVGPDYRTPGLIDDTGTRLTLAAAERRRGRLRPAAELKRRVLVERLRLCGTEVGR